MGNIGVLIETDGGSVKETNLGILTAARSQGENTIIALIMENSVAGAKDILGRYGAQTVVHVSAGGADMAASPDLMAGALAAVVDTTAWMRYSASPAHRDATSLPDWHRAWIFPWHRTACPLIYPPRRSENPIFPEKP
jgi:electron transfer flavoprotein alpha subunit